MYLSHFCHGAWVETQLVISMPKVRKCLLELVVAQGHCWTHVQAGDAVDGGRGLILW